MYLTERTTAFISSKLIKVFMTEALDKLATTTAAKSKGIGYKTDDGNSYSNLESPRRDDCKASLNYTLTYAQDASPRHRISAYRLWAGRPDSQTRRSNRSKGISGSSIKTSILTQSVYFHGLQLLVWNFMPIGRSRETSCTIVHYLVTHAQLQTRNEQEMNTINVVSTNFSQKLQHLRKVYRKR